MEQHTIIRLTDRPEYKESMAQWFHEKWGIPKHAYLDSMNACLKGESAVPQWYAVVEDGSDHRRSGRHRERFPRP